MAIKAADPRVGEADDEWPTTLRFSRQLGELYRGADYGNAIEGPYSRFRLFAWNRASSWLLLAWVVSLTSAFGQVGYLLLEETLSASGSADAVALSGVAAATVVRGQGIGEPNSPGRR